MLEPGTSEPTQFEKIDNPVSEPDFAGSHLKNNPVPRKKRKKRKCSAAMNDKKRALKSREYIANETAERREARLAHMREMAKARRMSETQEEREKRLRTLRLNQKNKIKSRKRYLDSIQKIEELSNSSCKINTRTFNSQTSSSYDKFKIAFQPNNNKKHNFLMYRDTVVNCLTNFVDSKLTDSNKPFTGFDSLSNEVVIASALSNYLQVLMKNRVKSSQSEININKKRGHKGMVKSDNSLKCKNNEAICSVQRSHSITVTNSHNKCLPQLRNKPSKESGTQLELSVLESDSSNQSLLHGGDLNPFSEFCTKNQALLNRNENLMLNFKSVAKVNVLGTATGSNNRSFGLNSCTNENKSEFNEHKILGRKRIFKSYLPQKYVSDIDDSTADENKNTNYVEVNKTKEIPKTKLMNLEMTVGNKSMKSSDKPNLINCDTDIFSSHQVPDSKTVLLMNSEIALNSNLVTKKNDNVLQIKRGPKIILKPIATLM